MSFIYTAFGDKIYIENFTETKESDTEEVTTIDKSEEVTTIDKSEEDVKVDLKLDFNVYSHIRIYNESQTNYISLYPRYLEEHKEIGGFAIFTKKDNMRESFLANDPFITLNDEANLIHLKIHDESNQEQNEDKKNMVINPKLGIFQIKDEKITFKKGDRELNLIYDFENKKLQTRESLVESKNNMIKFKIKKMVDKKEVEVELVNNYIFFDWSPSGSTRLNVYDNKKSDGVELYGSFYKINKDRDTFYLANVSDPDTVEESNPTNNYLQVGATIYSSFNNASLFAFKPITSEEEINKSVNINISDELIERFRFHGKKKDEDPFIESFNINKLIKALTDGMNDNRNTKKTDDVLNKYKTVITAMKEEKEYSDADNKSINLYDEMITLHSESLIIRNSFKYYLVAVEINGTNKVSKKLKYISFENKNLLSKNDVTKHLKVWVREIV